MTSCPKSWSFDLSKLIRFSLALILSLLATLPSLATAPQTLNYQGFLTSPGGTPVNTQVVMTFRLYNVSSGGTALYMETQPSVNVTNGGFNAIIGTVTPITLPFDVPYWLTVAVNSDAEMSPRQPLASGAYAFHASTATTAAAIQSSAVSAAVPIDGQVLIFRGGQWQPASDVANLLASVSTLNATVSALNSPRIYVANNGSNIVSVIDGAVVGSPIAVGLNPDAIALNAIGNRAYVGNFSGNSVTVIDTAGSTVVSTIPLASTPAGIALNPSGTRAYVTIGGTSNNVTVIDTGTNLILGTIGVGFNPLGIAVNPSGSRAYVANAGSNTVSVIDTSTNFVNSIVVGTGPQGIAVNPSGSRAYVTNSGSNSVSVIDTASNTVVGGQIAVGAHPVAIAVNPSGTRAYVVNNNSNNVTVIDTTANPNTAVGTIAVGASPQAIALNASGSRAYVTNYNSNNVTVIDTATNTVVGAPIVVGTSPVGIAVK